MAKLLVVAKPRSRTTPQQRPICAITEVRRHAQKTPFWLALGFAAKSYSVFGTALSDEERENSHRATVPPAPLALAAAAKSHLQPRPDTIDVVHHWCIGGVRVIYYWRVAEDQILMLLAYRKAKQSDLTPSKKRALKTVVENWNG
jgi:hypothetical protein